MAKRGRPAIRLLAKDDGPGLPGGHARDAKRIVEDGARNSELFGEMPFGRKPAPLIERALKNVGVGIGIDLVAQPLFAVRRRGVVGLLHPRTNPYRTARVQPARKLFNNLDRLM